MVWLKELKIGIILDKINNMESTIYCMLLLCCICCFTQNNFASDNDSTKANITDSIEPEFFDRPEVMPTFPGGVIELMKFLHKNFEYPKIEKDSVFESRFVIKFYVDKNGNIQDVKILNDVSENMKKEWMRVVNAMPKWIPATQNGKPVNCYYVLPIIF